MNSEIPNYLNFKDRLLQVWFNKYTIVLILIVFKINFFTKRLDNDIGSLKMYANDSLDSFNTYSKKMVELPHHYYEFVNELMVDNLNRVLVHLVVLIVIMISIIKAVVKFFIALYLGTILCLFNGLMAGVADVALDAIDTVLSLVNGVIDSATSTISGALDSLMSFASSVTSGINSIALVFSDNDLVDPSSFFSAINESITDLSSFQIPDSVFLEISSWKSKIPDFDDLESDAVDALLLPFDDLIDNLNSLMTYSPFSLDHVNRQLPPQSKFTPITNDEMNLFFDDLTNKINRASLIMLIVLIVLSVLVIIPLTIKEYYNWKKKYNLYLELDAAGPHNEFKFLNILNIYSNSVVYYFTKFTHVKNNWVLWILSYTSLSASITLLNICLAGFLTVLLQYILFNLYRSTIDDLPSDDIQTALMTSMNNNTQTFIKSTNSFIIQQQGDVNDELFGWIRNTSADLSHSINGFIGNLNDTLIDPFQSTPLESPISTVVYCILTKKLIMIDNGLNWLVNNLQIKFPTLPKNFKSSFDNLVSNTNNSPNQFNLSPYRQKIVNQYNQELFYETCIFLVILGIWLFQIVLGVAYSCYKYYKYNQVDISLPRPLTNEQKLQYGYPYKDPYAK